MENLANMGSIVAAISNLRTSGSNTRDRHGPTCLRDHANRPDLFRNGNPSGRDGVPRPLGPRGHQQTLLARLVATFTPTEADAIAGQLLETFGSLGQVLSASQSAIRKVTGHNELADVILLTKRIVLEAMREDLRRSVFSVNDRKFNEFLIATLGNAPQEQMLAIFLDPHARFIKDEVVAHGGWSDVRLKVRALLRRTIELDSAKVVLCHNHPSGDARPSKRDIEFTESLSRSARALGIRIEDHLIVAGPRICSMRAVGAMR